MKNWSTEQVPEQERYGYWQDVMCAALFAGVSVKATGPSESLFSGLARVRHYGDVVLAQLSSVSQDVVRSNWHVAHRTCDHVMAAVHLGNANLVIQDGREQLIKPGDLYILDMNRPCSARFPGDWSCVNVHIPRARILPLLNNPGRCTATVLNPSGGLGQLAASMIQQLVACPEDIGAEGREVVANSLVSLLAAAAGGTPDAREQGAAAVRRALYDTIVRYLEGHLCDPDLGVAKVALRFRISPRHLHKLFEPSGCSFAQTLIRLRLEQCARALANGNKRTITEIAFRYGFGDAPHFNRTFRSRFGVSPGEFRGEARIASSESAIPVICANDRNRQIQRTSG